MNKNPFSILTAAATVALAAMNASATMVVGDENTTTVVTPTHTIITVTNNATLTVTEPGEIEILLVGGGGGAGGLASGENGTNSGAARGGGGGGGGVIHKTGFYVEAKPYNITVGAGGVINTSHSTIPNATGGDTTGFDLIALGGGPGGCVDPAGYYDNTYLVGASGGGGSKNTKSYQGGKALANAENENMGHAGANAPEAKNAGGGGGAGSAASAGVGGDGYACNITGETVYYGGGGSGGRQYSAAVPGKGGGKANWGGGGSGQSTANSAPESGGPGIVIVRFTRTEQKTSADFKASGFDYKKDLDDGYAYLVITNNTTLSITGSASLDVLLVGGGGGAGGIDSSDSNNRGGGGGGGGVIHVRNFLVSAGDFEIAVGTGGVINASGSSENLANACGGNTTAFSFTAFGGGPGAPAGGYGDSIDDLGASGGGGATDGSKKTITGGTAKASDENFNLGNAGADAAANGSGSNARHNGGGGGGAGSAASGVVGGDGYLCDITGDSVYYGGGGAGGQRYTTVGTAAAPGQGGGKANWGGGASAQIGWGAVESSGGHGIVIIRYKKPERAFFIVVQ